MALPPKRYVWNSCPHCMPDILVNLFQIHYLLVTNPQCPDLTASRLIYIFLHLELILSFSNTIISFIPYSSTWYIMFIFDIVSDYRNRARNIVTDDCLTNGQGHPTQTCKTESIGTQCRITRMQGNHNNNENIESIETVAESERVNSNFI